LRLVVGRAGLLDELSGAGRRLGGAHLFVEVKTFGSHRPGLFRFGLISFSHGRRLGLDRSLNWRFGVFPGLRCLRQSRYGLLELLGRCGRGRRRCPAREQGGNRAVAGSTLKTEQ
jgi:hypothetical protein